MRKTEYQKIILPQELRLLLIPMRETRAVTAYLVVGTGSRYEKRQENGLSHFLEHLFFKGTKKRPTALDLAKELDSIGASYNAFTSEEMTGFYAQAEASKQSLVLEILADILQNSLFQLEEIEREKGVIIEEINLYQDTPNRYIYDLFKQLLYGDSPLGRLVIGEPKTILKWQKKDLLDYRAKHYLANRMVLAVAGRFSQEAEKEIVSLFGSFKKGSVLAYTPIQEKQKEPAVSLFWKQTDQAHLALGYRSIKRSSPLRYAQELLSVILGGSMSSRLFIELREKRGLCYHVSAEPWYFDDTGAFLVYAGVPIQKTEKAIRLILKEFERVAKEGVTEEELKRAKEFVKGKFALRMESSYQTAVFFAEQELLLKEIKTPEEEMEAIERVQRKEIQELVQLIFQSNQLNLVLIGPFENKEKFKRLLA